MESGLGFLPFNTFLICDDMGRNFKGLLDELISKKVKLSIGIWEEMI